MTDTSDARVSADAAVNRGAIYGAETTLRLNLRVHDDPNRPHVFVGVFAGTGDNIDPPDLPVAKSGDLTFRREEWHAIRALLEGYELVTRRQDFHVLAVDDQPPLPYTLTIEEVPT